MPLVQKAYLFRPHNSTGTSRRSGVGRQRRGPPVDLCYFCAMSQFEQIAAKAVESGGRLYVRSALNPILWLCGIVSVPGIVAASLSGNSPLWLVILILAPVCAAILGFGFLLVCDRDKLQSEEYQIRKRSLELIEQKGDAAPVMIDPLTLDVMPKPQSLPKGFVDGEGQ